MRDNAINRIIIHAKRAEGIAQLYFITDGFDGALTFLLTSLIYVIFFLVE